MYVTRRELVVAAAAAPLVGCVVHGSKQKALPHVQIGRHSISRLICGGNPIGGFAHSTRKMRELMSDFFTEARTVDLFERCWQEGINTVQSHWEPKIEAALRKAWDRGAALKWMPLAVECNGQMKQILAVKPFAVSHHGGYSDRYVREGHPEKIHDFVKHVHDSGALPGFQRTTRRPYSAFRIWDGSTIIHMCGLHNLSRTPQDIAEILHGDHPLENSIDERSMEELYLHSDRSRMYDTVGKLQKPCIVFKISRPAAYATTTR